MIRPRFRLLTLVGLLALMPLALTAEPADLLIPEATDMQLGCSQCEGSFTTSVGGANPSSHWGHGSDCASAYSDLATQVNQAASAACQANGYMAACNVQVVELACYPSGGQYISDGYGNYSCRTRGFFCQEP